VYGAGEPLFVTLRNQ